MSTVEEGDHYRRFSLVTAGPPSSTIYSIESTTRRPLSKTDNAPDNDTTSMQMFRKGFTTFERRIKIFIENMQRTHVMMNSGNVKFMDEMKKYEDKLPMNRTKLVVKLYRAKCYCEDKFLSPCPERCMDSCHYCSKGGSCWYNTDNCTEEIYKIGRCYCYDGSEKRCDDGQLDNCYERKTSEEPVVQPCMEFAPDRAALETSFMRFSELLIEPFAQLVRDLAFHLWHLKQSAVATGILNDIVERTCAEHDKPCLPEARATLDRKLTDLKVLQRNFTSEMMKTQEEAEKASIAVHNLKRLALNQLNQSIKNYTCCLQGLRFSVTDNECKAESTATVSDHLSDSTGKDPTEDELPTLSSLENVGAQRLCILRGDFLCDNNRCIPKSHRCDGEDDCGDLSDEVC